MNISLTGDGTGDDRQLQDFYNNLQAIIKIEPTPGYAIAEVASNDYNEQMALGTHLRTQQRRSGRSVCGDPRWS